MGRAADVDDDSGDSARLTEVLASVPGTWRMADGVVRVPGGFDSSGPGGPLPPAAEASIGQDERRSGTRVPP